MADGTQMRQKVGEVVTRQWPCRSRFCLGPFRGISHTSSYIPLKVKPTFTRGAVLPRTHRGKEPGIRVFEDPELFDLVTKAYMDLWGIPENNAKDFAEHARTRLPPKMERFLAERKKQQSKPQSPPQWMKLEG